MSILFARDLCASPRPIMMTFRPTAFAMEFSAALSGAETPRGPRISYWFSNPARRIIKLRSRKGARQQPPPGIPRRHVFAPLQLFFLPAEPATRGQALESVAWIPVIGDADVVQLGQSGNVVDVCGAWLAAPKKSAYHH